MSEAKSTLTRRRMVLGGAALGCVALVDPPTRLFASETAPPATADAQLLDDLRKLLRGELITPADASYDDARKVWNGMIDKHPLAIARCSGVADVISVVNYARDNDLPVSVRGGGHNVAGKALRDGAITIDLGPMHGIRVDPEQRTGRAQGGCRWAGFDRESTALGLVTTGGTVSDTGVGGLTLGGGLGWLMRKYGLTCDNLVSADVVTAGGRFLKASADENDDLFWALRGGGGNFGVVTSFEFRLHELEPIVGGMAMYPQAKIRDMLHLFRDFTSGAPDSVTTMAGVTAGPPGTPLEGQNAGMIAVCHSGPVDEGERLLAPFKEFGPPAIDVIGPMPYLALQTMFDAGSAPGGRNYWKSNFMTELADGAIDEIVRRSSEPFPAERTLVLIEHLGGAVGRVGPRETAFSNRHARYNTSILGSWSQAADDAENIAWTRAFSNALEAYATGGGYVNYMAADEDEAKIHATYKANYERLVEVKRKYDPTNFFSANQNIKP